jgi:protein-L-isoaspartate(D-aspartate) O-methyltransferase
MLTKEDSYKHKGWRKKLIEELKQQGITSQLVLDAFDAIPRHFFLDNAFEQIAYENRAFPIAANQTISQPYTVAFQTQLLDIQKGDKVLEVGTGSAFQSTILAELDAYVFTIERQSELYEFNKQFYPYKGVYSKLLFFLSDGFEGLPKFAPFDKVIITCGAPIIPTKLIQQMKVGGVMVIPLGEGEQQIMKKITKLSVDNQYQEENFQEFSFVPMLKGIK